MAKAKRIKTVEKLNLSEYTLDINVRKCSFDKFRFSNIEEYVRAVTGDREYQYPGHQAYNDLPLGWWLQKCG